RGRTHQEVAAADVDLILEGEGDRLAHNASIEVPILGDDARHTAFPARGQGFDPVAFPDDAAYDHAREAAEVLIRAIHPLHRHPERAALLLFPSLDQLQL